MGSSCIRPSHLMLMQAFANLSNQILINCRKENAAKLQSVRREMLKNACVYMMAFKG